MKTIGVIALTENGFILGEKIALEFSGIDLLTIKKKENWISNWDNLASLTNEAFQKYDGLVFIMALGIVVRMISKEIKSKDNDAAIVVIDEKGKNTISLLSGHLGGGNKLTEELASFLENNPVITTATDINNIYAFDSFASEYGLIIEPINNIKIFNKALLNNERIEVLIDKNIFLEDSVDIKNFYFYDILSYDHKQDKKKPRAIITNKIKHEINCDIYLRPKNIILGLGCKKNFSFENFENRILNFLEKENISIKSVKEIRSISLKKEELCILNFSKKYKIPFTTFSPEELNKMFEEFPEMNKSEFVFKTTGAFGVAEPAAIYSNKKEFSFILKRKELDGMTIAISEFNSLNLKRIPLKWLRKKEEL